MTYIVIITADGKDLIFTTKATTEREAMRTCHNIYNKYAETLGFTDDIEIRAYYLNPYVDTQYITAIGE
jgi:hypothetical protein